MSCRPIWSGCCVDRAPAVANWVRLYDETLARLTVVAGARDA